MQYWFGTFCLCLDKVALFRDEEKLMVEPKVLKLLSYFCQNPGRAISRRELGESVWEGRIVSDAAINRAIAEIRKVIERDVKQPELLTTVSKVGYQFNCIPNAVSDASSSNLNPAKMITPVKRRLLASLLLSLFVTVILLWMSRADDGNKAYEIQNEQALTMQKGLSFKGSWSPNGQAFSFIHRPEGGKFGQIWLAESGHTGALISDNYYYLDTIFIEDKRLVAARFNNLEQRQCELVSISLNTKEVTKLTSCGYRNNPQLAFNPETSQLFFNYRESLNEPLRVMSYDLRTQRRKQLTLPEQGGNRLGDYAFALDAERKRLAVMEYKMDHSTRVRLVHLGSALSVEEIADVELAYGVTWLDQDNLLLASSSGIEILSIKDGTRSKIHTNSGISHVRTGPSGNFYYTKSQVTSNLGYISKSSGRDVWSPSVFVSASVNRSEKARFANNSDSFVYFDHGAGIIIQTADGKTESTDFSDEILYVNNLQWSLDDQVILASINGGVFQYEVATKRWRQLAKEFSDIHFATYGTENKLLLSSNRSGDWQIWSLDPVSERSEQITQDGGYSMFVTSSGDLIYSKFNHDGLYRIPFGSRESELIDADFKIEMWRRWQLLARDNSLYILKQNGIWELNLDSLKQREIYKPQQRIFSFTLSSNKQNLLAELDDGSTSNIWQAKIN